MAGLNAFYYCVERCAWLIVQKLGHIFLCLIFLMEYCPLIYFLG